MLEGLDKNWNYVKKKPHLAKKGLFFYVSRELLHNDGPVRHTGVDRAVIRIGSRRLKCKGK